MKFTTNDFAFLIVAATFLTGATCSFIDASVDGDTPKADVDMQAQRKVTDSFITEMVAGQTRQGVSLQMNHLEPETYTLQFGFVGLSPGAIYTPSALAEVNWKVDGQQQRRLISIVSGAALSGVCNAVSVRLIDIANGAAPIPDDFNYKIQTTLSRGARGSNSQPPTLGTGDLNKTRVGAGALFFSVPQDAGVISVYPMVIVSDPIVLTTPYVITIAFERETPFGVFATYYPLINPVGWVPVPPGTTRVAVRISVGGATMAANVVWGIEG